MISIDPVQPVHQDLCCMQLEHKRSMHYESNQHRFKTDVQVDLSLHWSHILLGNILFAEDQIFIKCRANL